MPLLLADPKIRRAALDPRLLAWTAYRALAWPVLRGQRLLRQSRGKASPIKPPRTGEPNPPLTDDSRSGPRVVFDGAGLGEFVMLKRVADELQRRRPDCVVSYAMRDGEAVDAVRAIHPELDVSWLHDEDYGLVLRWLAEHRPDVLVLSENYRYPTLLGAATAFGTRAFLMNGRRRPRRVLRNRVLSWHHRWMIGMLSAMGMQSEVYASTARALARPTCDIQVTGDIKTDARVAPLLPEREADLLRWLDSDLPLVAAGSTDGLEEDAMVVAAFKRAREIAPCRLLLAPRRTTWMAELLELLRREGLTVRTRSQGDAGDSSADVLLLDSQGELSNAYRATTAAYVGGSYLKDGGGHNVMEPIAWGVPVAYGMERGHFDAIQRLVERSHVGTRVEGAEALVEFWKEFLLDSDERARVRAITRRFMDENRGAVERTVTMLIRLLELPEPSLEPSKDGATAMARAYRRA